MADRPAASLPEQMGEPAALKSAYRFLNNAAVTLPALIAPHCERTRAMAGQTRVVLLVEDTTELDYTAHPSKQGLGPIGDGHGQGLLVHSTLAVVPDTRAVLGLAHQQVVLRQPAPKPRPRRTQSAEGQVWAVSAQEVGPPPSGVTWVHVSDRMSDDFAYMTACVDRGKHFLLRLHRQRRLVWSAEPPPARPAAAPLVLDYARGLHADPQSSYTVHVPAHGKQPARLAYLALSWAPVSIPPPDQAPPEVRQHQPIAAWVLRAWEPDPPVDVDEPIEWILLTSLPILSLADAQRAIGWYTCRWICEDYHQCLKTGCQIERSQLDDGADIQRLLGFCGLIAVRLLQLRHAARCTPDVLASTVVDPLMVQVLARLRDVPGQTMTAQQFWRHVALLGGYQGRRHDGPPGWRTVWRGWRHLSDLTTGARLGQTLDSS
jgi:hypothetical protein